MKGHNFLPESANNSMLANHELSPVVGISPSKDVILIHKEVDQYKKIASRASAQIISLQSELQELLKVNFVGCHGDTGTHKRAVSVEMCCIRSDAKLTHADTGSVRVRPTDEGWW